MGVRHEVLNAKNHEREAFIVAQAGRYEAVTVSTNMAGRGTDILLGGNAEFLAQEESGKKGLCESLPPGIASLIADKDFYYFQRSGHNSRVPIALWNEIYQKHKLVCDAEHDQVVAAGGLHIVGTERHESRRIDNQLRGRAGRQGDPGSARFFLSLQDDLLRIFGGERIQNLMLRLGMEEDVPIESGLITKRIAAAQRAVEAQNFAARKHLLEYDDVMNKQRQAVYGLRRGLLEGKNQREKIAEIIDGMIGTFVDLRLPEGSNPDSWDLLSLDTDLLTQFGVRVKPADLKGHSRSEVEETVRDIVMKRYVEKEHMVGEEFMRQTEAMVTLHVIDNQWKDHLLSMDHLKEGIGLRGYGQKDPLIEYKKESYTLFQDMMDRIEDESIRILFFLQAEGGQLPFQQPDRYPEDEIQDEPEPVIDRKAAQSAMVDFTRTVQRNKEREMASMQFVGGGDIATLAPVVKADKVGRNDPCPCGSGKKYKKCHGS